MCVRFYAYRLTEVVNVPTYDLPYESCRRNGIGVMIHSLDLYIFIAMVFWYLAEE